MIKGQSETFDLICDNQIIGKDINTNFLMLFNGKFGGGKINLSPISLMNDGLIELGFYDHAVGTI